eukprot:1323198-Pyramimonas_sp.AAC.1
MSPAMEAELQIYIQDMNVMMHQQTIITKGGGKAPVPPGTPVGQPAPGGPQKFPMAPQPPLARPPSPLQQPTAPAAAVPSGAAPAAAAFPQKGFGNQIRRRRTARDVTCKVSDQTRRIGPGRTLFSDAGGGYTCVGRFAGQPNSGGDGVEEQARLRTIGISMDRVISHPPRVIIPQNQSDRDAQAEWLAGLGRLGVGPPPIGNVWAAGSGSAASPNA